MKKYIKDLGKMNYFYLRASDLNGLDDENYVSFLIGSMEFLIKVEVFRNRFEKGIGVPNKRPSKDWIKNGIHKSLNIPKWLIKFNEADLGTTKEDSKSYSPKEVFVAGDIIEHMKFGLGKVVQGHGDKVSVMFPEGLKILIHNRGEKKISA